MSAEDRFAHMQFVPKSHVLAQISIYMYCVYCSDLRYALSVSYFRPGPEVTKPFSCSIQLSMKFQMRIKTNLPTMKKFLALSLSDAVVSMLINVKMPTIVGI